MKFKAIIFDLGGVFVDWNPRHYYKNIFDKEEDMEYFLTHICTNDWNENQDAGKDIHQATNELVQEFPDYEKYIRMYYDNWEGMLNGYDKKMEQLLQKLQSQKQLRLYALTNWSQYFFPRARQIFDFLKIFEDIVVSGEEKIRKPAPEIYLRSLKRFNLKPTETIFIDDNLRNIKAAQKLNIYSIHFTTYENLVQHLQTLGIIC